MSNKEIHPKFKLNGNHFITIEELLAYSKSDLPDVYEFFSEWFSNKKYLTVYTSGSTGKPKPIKLLKDHMINSALATARYFDLDGDDITALLCMSPKFIAGKMMLVRAIVSGWNLDVIAPTSHLLITRKIYDFVAMVPLQVYNSLEDIHKVKTLIVGGGAVSTDLQEKLKNVRPKVYATYGMTETVTHVAVKKLSQLDGITNYYEVLPGITVEKDSRNCLVIDAPNISKEKIITNDIVKLIDDKHFCWQGRFDNIINSGGVKIIPEKVEEQLEKVINQRFFIGSIDDEALGKKVILIIEGDKKEIINFDDLDKYEKPKAVFYMEKFEETKSGKINRKATLEKIKQTL